MKASRSVKPPSGPQRMSEDLLADGEGTPLGMPIVDRVLACEARAS